MYDSIVNEPLPQTRCKFLEVYIDFGAVKVVHSKSSVKREPSLTLRMPLNKSWPTLICMRHIGGQDPSYSECGNASIDWQFWVYEYINELIKDDLKKKIGKARLP